MKVTDLKLELELRGKETKGLKAELVVRLSTAIDEKAANVMEVSAVLESTGRPKELSGFPESAYWKQTKSAQMAVRGTVKAAVLMMGDPDCLDLIAASVYDTKPVHFLSMSAELIQWVRKERKIFDPEKGAMEFMQFLRLNINDDHNNGMGDVDVSDQLRNYYRCDHWLRKTKWWRSILFWGEGVTLVNAFILYSSYNRSQGVDPKHLFSQYEFRKQVALAWIAPEQHDPRCNGAATRARKRKEVSSVASFSRSLSFATKQQKVDRRHSERLVPEEEGSKPTTATKFTSKNLSPTGALGKRLNSGFCHLPMSQQTDKAKCQLHRWAASIEFRKGTLWCPVCYVHLCVGCYSTFHTVENLVEMKDELADKLIKEKSGSGEAKTINNIEIGERAAV